MKTIFAIGKKLVPKLQIWVLIIRVPGHRIHVVVTLILPHCIVCLLSMLVSLYVHELLTLNLNVQEKNEQNNMLLLYIMQF